jgi:translation initiation factor 1 (eIF-1/SUI1)
MGTGIRLKSCEENKIPRKGITMVKDITEKTAANKLQKTLKKDFFQYGIR